ncbi:MAG: putative DNA binding domain-containing protein [Candidatus Methanomethylophilaceae archaeon]|nr:putative DNA binding domain-containing protein [Candidatus Methanomethylophilaceae archaeon]
MLSNIEDIIYNRTIENSRVEYKEDWNPTKVARTICAFANDIDNIGGGYIIIGISESDGIPQLPPKGIQKTSIDDINKELIGICNLIEPRYIPSTKHVVLEGRDILVIETIVGSERPYKCPDEITKDKTKRTGKSYYIRKLSSTIVADAGDGRRLYEVSSRTPFDCRVNLNASLRDLESNLVREYLSRIGSPRDETMDDIDTVFRDLKIVGNPPYEDRPINAGLMFFTGRPEKYFEGARIEVVMKPDPTGEGMIERVFDGPLDMQLQYAIDSLRNNVMCTMVRKSPDTPVAQRISNYPLAAVEELLSNAVYHKDYSLPEPITVTVTADSLSILSAPGPDMSITDHDIETFRMSSTRYRNARIGDLLKHRGLAEKRGTGIPTVLRSLESNGSDPPVFETDPERTFFRATIRIHEAFLENTSATIAPIVKDKGADLRPLVLELVRDHGSLSMRELTESLGYSRNAKNVYETVRELVESGRLEYTHPDKMSSRHQRIRLRLD